MMPTPQLRAISWNGISCELPELWNVIVKGNRHLIIEQNLQPLLEFRWQTGTKSSSKEPPASRILSRITKETTKIPELTEPPEFLRGLYRHYEVTAFRLDDGVPDGAIVTCRKCATAMLFQFFGTSPRPVDYLANFFSTLECCRTDKENSLWAMEDLTFKIPGTFILDNYLFSLGLVRLSFKKNTAGLKLIRLSAASKHLEQHTLLELFTNFHGNGVERTVQLDERTLILDAPPSLGDLLLKTIKRKKIYRWAKFSYCTEEDKILGIRLESSRPLDRQQVSFIEKNYGFIQKKTAGSRDDQRAGTGLHTSA